MTKSDPIFILGIMQRSGTNWLRDLLLCHPDCYGASIHEDFLVANSHLLMRFSSSLYQSWPENWRANERVGPQERLQRMLGDALLEFIGQAASPDPAGGTSPGPRRRLVTKTPCIANLEHAFNFFPSSQVIVLVRDGRAVVESLVRGFSWGYERAIRQWDKAARTILRFRDSGVPELQRTIFLRYEDLCSAKEAELRRVLAFLDLDPTTYDFGEALRMPVRGSSVPGKEHGSEPGAPAERDEARSPVARAAGWDHRKHERFNHLAGDSLERFGYHRVRAKRSSLLAPAVHWYKDAKWSVPRRLMSAGILLKRALGQSDPDFKDRRSLYYVCERRFAPRGTTTSGQADAGSQGSPKPPQTRSLRRATLARD